MKKIISLLVVATLLVVGMAISAFAADSTTITVEKVTAAAGSELTMEVSITGNPGFAAAKFTVEYDETALTLVKVDATGYLLDGATINNGIVAFAKTANVTGDGVLFTVTFTVNEGVADGDYAVSVTLGKFIQADRTAIDYTVEAGCVTVAHACDLQDVEEVPATCTENGVKAHQKCTICGKLYLEGTEVTEADLVIEAGHVAGEVKIENEVPATCTAEGSHDEVVYCSVCGEELSRKTVVDAKLAHTEGEVVIENEVPATCTTEGSYDEVVYCTECGEEISRNTVVVPKIAHSFVDGVCEHCGETEKSAETGDSIFTAVAVALLSMLGVAALIKKREF